ncbi:glycosyltransferase family 4 protein [Rhodovulum visakhapatnamense]|uniref:Glycosyltransferase involved in cell wall biosynthesis n=1 Tax=Rhodovulum visakhapatnamense TaxID=364297 RepID=A0A4R8FI81_9RHOB|nr:glycosyltransferase family 4 protein [Rhodovulum visakhapatnamense]TDX21881.1 glycosyltransferase involved in cell wall biosynthesis [Rhodovulum visakhapatnamense]
MTIPFEPSGLPERTRTADGAANPVLPRIAYFTGQYPQVSLTFILREIEALRTMGAEVLSCSARQTPPNLHPGPAEREAAATTFYVLKALRNPLTLVAALSWLATRPRRCARGLRLAWATRAPGLKGAVYQLIYFLEALVLGRHLERHAVGHLHNHFVSGSATVSMLVSDLTGIPCSFTLHGPADLLEPSRWRLDEKVARARFVAAISHYARSQTMLNSDPAHWDRIRIVHCGVAPGRYEGPDPRREDDEIRLLFVGRLAPVKGLRVLFEALQTIGGDLPGLRLTLAGDGPDRAGLEAAVAGLGGRVRFTGYLSQEAVAAEMKQTDIVVLPSFAEGVPVVLMEAMASRRPVIATQVAGVGELVEHGRSGLIVPPGDAAGLAAAIRRLARDPALRAAMGEAGRKRVLAEFDIATEAARMARLIAEGPGQDLRPAPLGTQTARQWLGRRVPRTGKGS